MNYFFQVVGVLAIVILLISVIERIVYRFNLIRLFKKWYYRILYHNYDIWFKSKRMTEDECTKFLNDYKEALKNNRVSKNDNHLIRFQKAVLKRLNKIAEKRINN